MDDNELLGIYSNFVTSLQSPDNYEDIEYETASVHEQPYIIQTRVRLMKRAVSGLVNEAGEMNQRIHKTVYRGHNLDLHELVLEASDALHYLQLFCNAVGITLLELMQTNITKLTSRYPDGYTRKNDVEREEQCNGIQDTM